MTVSVDDSSEKGLYLSLMMDNFRPKRKLFSCKVKGVTQYFESDDTCRCGDDSGTDSGFRAVPIRSPCGARGGTRGYVPCGHA